MTAIWTTGGNVWSTGTSRCGMTEILTDMTIPDLDKAALPTSRLSPGLPQTPKGWWVASYTRRIGSNQVTSIILKTYQRVKAARKRSWRENHVGKMVRKHPGCAIWMSRLGEWVREEVFCHDYSTLDYPIQYLPMDCICADYPTPLSFSRQQALCTLLSRESRLLPRRRGNPTRRHPLSLSSLYPWVHGLWFKAIVRPRPWLLMCCLRPSQDRLRLGWQLICNRTSPSPARRKAPRRPCFSLPSSISAASLTPRQQCCGKERNGCSCAKGLLRQAIMDFKTHDQ